MKWFRKRERRRGWEETAAELVAAGTLTPEDVHMIWLSCRAGQPTPPWIVEKLRARDGGVVAG